MEDDTETASVDDAEDSAAFGAGFGDAETKVEAKPKDAPKAEPPKGDPAQAGAPEYVQITREDWEKTRAAAEKTASHETQLSRAFGTVGKLQQVVNELKASTPRGGKVEIPKEAFAAMEKDFPELAEQVRAALTAALAGVSGTGKAEADPDAITRIMAEATMKRAVEDLEDAYPDWRDIVGAVDATKTAPDPNNPFRKWLATQSTEYQARINATQSPVVIERAINRFKTETKAPPKTVPTPRAQQQRGRIEGAMQPRGDGGAAPTSDPREEAFAAGFGR